MIMRDVFIKWFTRPVETKSEIDPKRGLFHAWDVRTARALIETPTGDMVFWQPDEFRFVDSSRVFTAMARAWHRTKRRIDAEDDFETESERD